LESNLIGSGSPGILRTRVNFTGLRIVPYKQRKKIPRVFILLYSKHFVIAHRSRAPMAAVWLSGVVAVVSELMASRVVLSWYRVNILKSDFGFSHIFVLWVRKMGERIRKHSLHMFVFGSLFC